MLRFHLTVSLTETNHDSELHPKSVQFWLSHHQHANARHIIKAKDGNSLKLRYNILTTSCMKPSVPVEGIADKDCLRLWFIGYVFGSVRSKKIRYVSE